MTNPADFSEETDPAKLWPPDGKHWGAFMNHNWLPAVSKRYGTELCDQRGLWKRYLTENSLQPKQLLIDGVHLNAHGEFLMAQCVKAYLRYDPSLGPAAADGWVKTYEVGKDIAWHDGVLRLALEGNRVDVIVKPGAAPPAAVKIDGRRPSEFPELYGFTRTHAKPGGKWPPIAPVKSEKLLVLEDWTMEVVKDRQDPKNYRFTLQGSKTGPDGEGRSERAVRVAVRPDRDRAGGLERGLRLDAGRGQTRARPFHRDLERRAVFRRPVRLAGHRGSDHRDCRDAGPGTCQRKARPGDRRQRARRRSRPSRVYCPPLKSK